MPPCNNKTTKQQQVIQQPNTPPFVLSFFVAFVFGFVVVAFS